MRHVSTLALGIAFTWWAVLSVGFFGKVARESLQEYGQYLTNWAWTLSWFYFTVEVAGYLEEWITNGNRLLRWNAIILFFPVWGVAWLVFWLVFLLFYENPNVILVYLHTGINMGIVFDMDRLFHVLPAVVILAYMFVRWRFIISTYAHSWYPIMHPAALSSTEYQKRRDQAQRMGAYTKGYGSMEGDGSDVASAAGADRRLVSSEAQYTNIVRPGELPALEQQQQTINFADSRNSVNLRPFSSNVEDTLPYPHLDDDEAFYNPKHLNHYANYSPSPTFYLPNDYPGTPHDGDSVLASLSDDLEATQRQQYSSGSDHHFHNDYEHLATGQPNVDYFQNGFTVPGSVSMADTVDPRGDSLQIILAMFWFIGAPIAFLLIYTANHDYREVYHIGDTPLGVLVLMVATVLFIMTGITIVLVYIEAKLYVERTYCFNIIGGILVKNNINPEESFPALFEIYAIEDPYIKTSARVTSARTFEEIKLANRMNNARLMGADGTSPEDDTAGLRRRTTRTDMYSPSSGDIDNTGTTASKKTKSRLERALDAQHAVRRVDMVDQGLAASSEPLYISNSHPGASGYGDGDGGGGGNK